MKSANISSTFRVMELIKLLSKIKKGIRHPELIIPYLREETQKLIYKFANEEYKFTEIYRHTHFGGKISASGPGSDIAQTSVISQEIPALIKELNAKVLLDAPCGDFYWMQHIKMDLEKYIGIDIVQEMIKKNKLIYGSPTREFIKKNIIKDSLPKADLILCRDCLVHLSFKQIFPTIKNFWRSKSTYLLTTTFPEHQNNVDVLTGGWRSLNLELPPFNFPKPLKLINEKCSVPDYQDKSLGLWKIEDIIKGLGK